MRVFPWDHQLILSAAKYYGLQSKKAAKLYQTHLSKSCDNSQILELLLNTSGVELLDHLYLYISQTADWEKRGKVPEDLISQLDPWKLRLIEIQGKLRRQIHISDHEGHELQNEISQFPYGYSESQEYQLIESIAKLAQEQTIKNVMLLDNIGNSLLYYSTKFYGHNPMINLIEAGVDVHHANCHGYTPFHFISKNPPAIIVEAMNKMGVLSNYHKELLLYYTQR